MSLVGKMPFCFHLLINPLVYDIRFFFNEFSVAEEYLKC